MGYARSTAYNYNRMHQGLQLLENIVVQVHKFGQFNIESNQSTEQPKFAGRPTSQSRNRSVVREITRYEIWSSRSRVTCSIWSQWSADLISRSVTVSNIFGIAVNQLICGEIDRDTISALVLVLWGGWLINNNLVVSGFPFVILSISRLNSKNYKSEYDKLFLKSTLSKQKFA